MYAAVNLKNLKKIEIAIDYIDGLRYNFYYGITCKSQVLEEKMAYKTKEWRNSMRVTVDYNYMMSKSLGDKGVTDSEIKGIKDKAEKAFDYVMSNRGKDELFMGWTELPYNQDAIVADILATAKQVRKKFKYFVVLGIGGSALGPSMAFNALKHLHHNELPPKKRGGPKFYVEDNVDPVRMQVITHTGPPRPN